MKGTVKSKADMERLFHEGRRSSSSLLTVISNPSPTGCGRWGFIAGKKLGVAPLRSRCKRVMRAAAADLKGPWDDLDVVFVAKRKVAFADHDRVVREMTRCLQQAGVQLHV